MRWTGVMAIGLAIAAGAAMAEPIVLENADIRVTLDLTAAQTPRIAAAERIDENATILFRDESETPLSRWMPEGLVDASTTCTPWLHVEDDMFVRAEASRRLANGLEMTWRTELPPEGAWLRMRIILSNHGDAPFAVEWFPIWNAAWRMSAINGPVRYWDALSFLAHDEYLEDGQSVALASRIHSSDTLDDGKNPYWRVGGGDYAAYFSLDWCGGWQAELASMENGLAFRVFLPPDETQLVLQPGETLAGPALNAVFAGGSTEPLQRADWIRQRIIMADLMYGGPAPSYPFSWNHWYTARFAVDGPFLNRQIEAMPPYGFDYFIVDAGWYEACGKWEPDPEKFGPGEFENAMERVHDAGATPGIWTCPQFVHPEYAEEARLELDEPGFFREFIDGRLVDLAGSDFSAYLVDHVRKLRGRYFAGWWKYDQDLFTGELSKGRMRNVLAWQEALMAVRKDQPDLYIENCQSGGRMINEFTVLLAQSQWIRDGSQTGLDHARSNIREALAALEFLPPWTVIRWTNRPYDNDTEDDELTRMYCRSAMGGIWGLVADLPEISGRQRSVIVEEIARYRRFNEAKRDNLYEIHSVPDNSDAVGVVYWTADNARAAVLLLRWDTRSRAPFPKRIAMPFADDPGEGEETRYRVEHVDRASLETHTARALREHGLDAAFSDGQRSLMIFVERIP